MSYLGRSGKLSLKAQEKVSFLATAGQTSKTGLSYVPSFVEVYVNGVLLTDTTDFTATNGSSVTFTVALLLNDEVTVISLKTFTVADHYSKTEADTLLAAKLPLAGGTMTGVIAGFTSTGIDDNATSTAITIDSNENVTIGADDQLNMSGSHNEGGALIHLKGTDTPAAGKNLGALNFGNSTDASLAMIRGLSTASDAADMLFFTEPSGGAIEERMRIDSGGNVTVNNGNLVIGTNGKGIDFSANADSSATGASTTSELLDDYEEGTWTPYFTSINSTAPTGNMVHAGSYTKVGRVVNLIGYMQITSGLSVGGGTLAIAGLPFPAVTSNGYNAAGFVGVHSNWDPARYPNGGLSFYTTVALGFLTANHDTAWGWEQTNTLNNQTHMRWSITYFTS